MGVWQNRCISSMLMPSLHVQSFLLTIYALFPSLFLALRPQRLLLFPITYALFASLFCSCKNVNTFVFCHLRTLCAKQPGVGYPWTCNIGRDRRHHKRVLTANFPNLFSFPHSPKIGRTPHF